MIRIGAGYKAKIVCSEIFLAGRDAETILNNEFDGMDSAMQVIAATVDHGRKQVRAHGPMGLGASRAVYRDGYGCTLANGRSITDLPAPVEPMEATPWREAGPVSGAALRRVDYAALDAALSNAFEHNDLDHRSVLVAVDGRIVGERYAAGFDRDTPFISWSMAKSVTGIFVGAASLHGLLDVNDPAPVPEWAGDPEKSQITWNDLLRMQSGLAFGEHYNQVRSDVNRMLFESADTGGFAARMPVEHRPGDHWYYSSGTTNLIARTLRQELAKEGVDFHAFAREAILDPIGATSVVLETDAAGTFIGSSYAYATTRDWARLGQLYLQNGAWGDERLLPENWMEYALSPATASNGRYGAQLWLNRDGEGERKRFFEEIPESMFFFNGHEGQHVFIFPDKRMVIVRTGQTRGSVSGVQAITPLVNAVYAAVDLPEITAK